jgi:hypothetical protein
MPDLSKKVMDDEKIELIDGKKSIYFEKVVDSSPQVETVTFLNLCRDCQNTKNLLTAQQNSLETAWVTLSKAEKATWQDEYEKSI